jgi:hypothetical protein
VVFQFFAPFMLLLSGRTKRTPEIIRLVAILVLVARALDLFWNLAPFSVSNTYVTTPLEAAIPYALAWIVVGALWLVTFEFYRKKASDLPTYDARLELAEAGHHA